MKHALVATTAALALAASAGTVSAQSRDQIRIVGSSTVFPFSTVIAENFAAYTGNPAPVVESTGTGGGMQIFCEGVGIDKVDATGASRPMQESEYRRCVENGVTDITELLLGYDGIAVAVAQGGQTFDISLAQLFQALAAEVEVDGAIVPNPYARWSDIDPALPGIEITVFGPPPTSGTRDAWIELVMLDGCATFPAIAALKESDEARFEEVCQRMREDGHFIEAGENDNLIVQRLVSDPATYGIFGYSFYHENRDRLSVLSIEGVAPDIATIADFSYPVARPLFLYFKNAHRTVIPGLQEFIEEASSEEAIGDDGYLVDIGLVPPPREDRETARAAALGGAQFARH
jgi:phosphate transport system substrate-binding protein